MMAQRHEDRRTLDPLISLQVAMDVHSNSKLPMGAGASRSSITSLCFLHTTTCSENVENLQGNDDESEDSSSSDDDDEVQFQCQQLLRNEAPRQRDPTLEARQTSASISLLDGRFVASCHANGETLLWDLSRRQAADAHFLTIKNQQQPTRGPGLTIRRMSQQSLLLYQTRDPLGTVSIHALGRHSTADNIAPTAPIVTTFETRSQTFCAAVPCHGDPNLLALPSIYDDEATIRDIRIDSSASPVAHISAALGYVVDDDNDDAQRKSHGMLTSMALAADSSHGGRLVLACGMESGVVFYHDMAMTSTNKSAAKIQTTNHIEVTNDPILALDIAQSPKQKSSSTSAASSSFVTVAGMAGDAVEMKQLPSSEQGSVAVVKATLSDPKHELKQDADPPMSNIRLRLRSRLRTCLPTGGGKPGVNLCRFRPGDGRLFAVGGWDKRLRIYDRALTTQQKSNETQSLQHQGPLVAILRGHTDSVAAMDWAPDATESGLLATGAADGRILIWRCFSQAPSC